MRALFSTLTTLIVLICAIAIIAGFILFSRLPDAISSHLSKSLKVPVSIEKIEADFKEIDAFKIHVSNLPHSILNRAFSCQKLSVMTPIYRYLQSAIVIQEIHLDAVYLGLEFDSAKGTSGNWSILMKNLSDTMNSGSPSSRSVLIQKVVITNLAVDVVYRKDGSRVHHLPPIDRLEFTNISSQGGFPMDQLMNSVLGEMLKEVFIKQNLQNMLQDFLNPTNPIREYIMPKLF
ncbi:MAG: hypothetical protein RLZZ453_147 [Chlamydiota bacterium]|jgi:hypothetical protein